MVYVFFFIGFGLGSKLSPSGLSAASDWCIQLASDWVSIVFRLVLNLHQIGCRLAFDWGLNWHQIGSQLSLDWFSIGIRLDLDWHLIGC